MNLKQAKDLIAFENNGFASQLWLDLGCGTGLFTVALSGYLPTGSTIIAIDRETASLRQLPQRINNVTIERKVCDFVDDSLGVGAVDGILMANSLHYVKDKENFIEKLALLLKPNALFLLVEYDRTRVNKWVPYPLTINGAKDLFTKAGYSNFAILNKTPSAYGGEIYAALIS
jgi:ubiquinone/menaquinone biosynthesis C-methylase UbiE